MKKWIALPMAALMLAAMAIPSMAQDAEKKEARTVTLKETYKQGEARTEKSEDSSTTLVSPKDVEMVLQKEIKGSSETKVIEILGVNDDGKITSARIKWTEGVTVTETEQMGAEPTEPVEEDAELKGVSILYTWNAEKKAYTAKVEKGDADNAEVKKQAGKKDPFINPFVPNRDVKVGESWEAKEEDLKAMMGEDEGIKLKSISATCKAEEILEEEGVEVLRVSVVIKMTGELQDENLGKPTLEASRTGSFYWSIKDGRATRVELENEGGFECDVDNPQAPNGKMTLKVTVGGEEAIKMSYGKVEEKKEEGSDDGDEDEDDMK